MKGRENVTKAIKIANSSKVPGVLGIIDQDLDSLQSNVKYPANILVTETRDLEGLLIKYGAFEKLVSQNLLENSIENSEKLTEKLLEITLSIGSVFGYMQFVSNQKGWTISFKKITLNDCLTIINVRNYSIKYTELISIFERHRGKRAVLPTSTELQAEIDTLRDTNHDPWCLSRGHDLINILHVVIPIVLKDKWRRAKLRELEENMNYLKDSLVLAFERTFFAKTQLYSQIRIWESENYGYIILLSEI